MEFFRRLGIEDRVRAAGASMSPTMGMHSGPSLKEVIEGKPCTEGPRKFPLAGMIENISPVNGMFVTQDMIEPVLKDAASGRGVDLRFHTECLGVEQNDHRVVASLKSRETGAISTVQSDILIAADGSVSPIRSRLNFPTTGRGTMGHLLNILFQADLKSLVEKREFSLCRIERPEVSGLFTSINNSDRWVFHLQYEPLKGEKASDFTPERCIDLLRIAIRIPDLKIDITSILPWEPSVRIAEQLQHGRIFLAGDAAHQMPPWAGQGANSGIADVHNLAWKLALVLSAHASKRLLTTYDVERLPVGRAAAEASTNAADAKGIISTKKNLSFIIGMLRRIHIMSGHGYCYDSKAICWEDISPLWGITWRAWTLPSLFLAMDGRPGSRAPHIWVEHDGKRISTLDVCGKGFVLLTGSRGFYWTTAVKSLSADVDLTLYSIGPEGELVAPEGLFESAAGITSGGAILIRPDDFICWRIRRSPSLGAPELGQALRQALGFESV